jgi:hypothetical protein
MLLREYHNTGDDQGLGVSNTRWVAQTFTPKFDQKINMVKVKLYRDTILEPGTVTLSIKATASAKPSGADLASATINGNLLTTNTNGEWVTFTLNTDVNCAGGVLFCYCLRCTGTGSYPLKVRADSSSGYSRGQHGYSDDGGGTWTMSSTQDDMFETYSEDPTGDFVGFFVGGAKTQERNLWFVKFFPSLNEFVISEAWDVKSGSTDVYAVAVGLDGSVYVTFNQGGAKTRKFTSAMVLDDTWGTAGEIADGGVYLAVDDSGYLAIARALATNVRLYDPSGSLVWSSPSFTGTGASARYVKFDSNGDVIASGTRATGAANTKKFSRVDGSLLQDYCLVGGVGISYGFAIWPNNSLAICHAWQSSPNYGKVRKVDSANNIIWSDLTLDANVIPRRPCYDASNCIFIPTNDGSDNKNIRKVASDGSAVVATFNCGALQIEVIATPGVTQYILAVGASATDEDVTTGSIRAFDTDLARLATIGIAASHSLNSIVLNTIPPLITDQSGDTTVNEGSGVNFYVTATGQPTPSYQWYFEDILIPGETNSTLSFTADRNDAGTYTCRVYNVAGEDWSDPIELTVQYLEITGQSSDTTIALGQLISLFVTAGGIPSPTYQWYKGDVLIPGETGATLAFYIEYSDVGVYKCAVTNVVGTIWSNPINVNVTANPYTYRLLNHQLDQVRDT